MFPYVTQINIWRDNNVMKYSLFDNYQHTGEFK